MAEAGSSGGLDASHMPTAQRPVWACPLFLQFATRRCSPPSLAEYGAWQRMLLWPVACVFGCASEPELKSDTDGQAMPYVTKTPA